MRNECLRFQSSDGRFGFQIDTGQLTKILDFCRISGEIETGGILIGHYSDAHDNAIVTDVTGPPKDSNFGMNWFYRGVDGLQNLLLKLWNSRRNFYLGEWHLHPGGKPFPSRVDIQQMMEIANSPKFHCPEPILLIMGKTPRSKSFSETIRVFVFTNSGEIYQLNRL